MQAKEVALSLGIVLLTPLILLFQRNFDSYAIFLITFPILLCCVLPVSVYMIYRLARSGLKSYQKVILVSLFVTITLTNLVFWKEISIFQEIYRYRRHKDNFASLVAAMESNGNGPCWDACYRELSSSDQDWSNRERVLVSYTNENKLESLTLLSRSNTYFTYFPHAYRLSDTSPSPTSYSYSCFYQLDDYWFVCSVTRN